MSEDVPPYGDAPASRSRTLAEFQQANFPTPPDAQIKQALEAKLPGKYYQMPKGEFVVSFTGTSKDLSDALGITDGTAGTAMVASISGYYGRAPNDLWEWIKQHWTTS
jgi:hypothetical protein